MPYRVPALLRPARIAVLGTIVLMTSGSALAADKPKPAGAPPAASQAKAPAPAPAAQPKLVDINSASRAELKTLPNIGDAEADRIIANRPYLTKSHLVAKKVLDLAPYDALRGRIIAVQATQPKAKP